MFARISVVFAIFLSLLAGGCAGTGRYVPPAPVLAAEVQSATLSAISPGGWVFLGKAHCGLDVFLLTKEKNEVAKVYLLRGGRKFITLPMGAVRRGKAFARFLIAHECGHHVHGHKLGYGPDINLNHQREWEADAYAFSYLRMVGDRSAIQAWERYLREMNYPATDTHPSDSSRLKLLYILEVNS